MNCKTLKFILIIILSNVSINLYADTNSYSRHFMVQPEFFSSKISKITILPVVDDRKDKSVDTKFNFNPNFSYMIRAKTSGELITMKGYDVDNVESYGLHKSVHIADLQAPSKEWIQSLGPNNSTHNLILVFSDTQSVSTFGNEGSAEISAYLFDKKLGKLVWENRYESQVGQGGLLGLTTSDYQTIVGSIRIAVWGLFKGFPDQGMSSKSFNSMWKVEVIQPTVAD